jgi:4-hydroxybenzoate polyprenyltransferase
LGVERLGDKKIKYKKIRCMSKEQTTTVISSSLTTTLFVVFLVLKLTDNIDWSWWWVTSPLWLPLAILIGFVALIITVGIILVILNKGDV